MKLEVAFSNFEWWRVRKYPRKVRLENRLSDHRFCNSLRRLPSTWKIRSRLHSLNREIFSGLESGARSRFRQAAERRWIDVRYSKGS